MLPRAGFPHVPSCALMCLNIHTSPGYFRPVCLPRRGLKLPRYSPLVITRTWPLSVAHWFLFVYWYMMRFVGESPFSHSALDIKTYAMALLKMEYRAAVKRNMPKRWFDRLPHSHKALDDALEQGALFCNMLAENQAS